jgi:acetylornithine/succinyldiaminopimelate/putrescine aminotransferase
MTLAKGLGGGVPIGAILAKERASVFSLGEHGSTLGGNPLACAVAYATTKFILDNDVIGNAKRMGGHLIDELGRLKSKFNFITEVRGRGLLLAIQFDRDIAAELVKACLERGLLLNAVKPDALRFMPPLIVTESEVDEAIAILDKVLNDCLNQTKQKGDKSG